MRLYPARPRFLGTGAIAVLRLNLRLHRASPIAYDRLGDAYMKKGDSALPLG
jgi:hypothetical protein